MKAIRENVGPYRPIMQPNVERVIAEAHRGRSNPSEIEEQLDRITTTVTMDLNLFNSEIDQLPLARPEVTMNGLTRILNAPNLMPEGWSATPAGQDCDGRTNHLRVANPEGRQWTVTTDREAHDYAPDRLE